MFRTQSLPHRPLAEQRLDSAHPTTQNRYVLLTAAKNEQKYIGEVIHAVLRQNVLPTAWFIVDDGSTDETAAIVQRFAARHPFIHLHRSGHAGERSFGAKDKAINEVYRTARHLDYDFVGVQDADAAPEQSTYYEEILRKFNANPHLGVAGGYIYERSGTTWRCRRENSEDSVAGGLQMFRRACFDQIGGYTPLHVGGEDWLAQLEARIAGWEVRAYPEHHVFHHRPTSSADGRLRGIFRSGLMDGAFGSHPVFELFKCCRRLLTKPYLLSGLVRLSGYAWWRLIKRKPLISPEKVCFLRKQQLTKLRTHLAPMRWMRAREIPGVARSPG